MMVIHGCMKRMAVEKRCRLKFRRGRVVFSKKRYFDKKWRYKWLISDSIVFVVCVVFAEFVWRMLGIPMVGFLLEVVGEGLKITLHIGGLREKLLFLSLILIILVVCGLIIAITSLPIYGIYLGVRATKRRHEKQRVSYDVIQDIDYFREEFKDLSPAMISMLMNLKIERKKDVAATLLSLEQKGFIRVENGMIQAYPKSGAELPRSEQLLLELIIGKRMNAVTLGGWELAGIRETMNAGLLTYNKSKLRFLIRIAIYIAIMVMSVKGFYRGAEWIDEASWRVDELLEPYEEQFDRDVSQLSYDEQIAYLEEQLAVPEMQEAMLILAEMVMVIVYGFMMFLMPLVIVGAVVAQCVSRPKYKRTRKGKILTEQIAGMKRFIHDFSNLKEAEKEQLALWDEFLVYAVVLEENEQIVKEIGNIRKVDLTKFRMAE